MDKPDKVSQNRFMRYQEAMLNTYAALSEEEKAELHAWEKENLDGHSVATSDWPGWRKYIGPPPWRCEDGEHPNLR